MTDRRQFLQCAAALVGSAAGSPVLAAASSAADSAAITVTRLAEDLVLYSGAGGNVVTLGNGTVRVEGQMVDAPVAKRARELVAYAEAINGVS